MLASKNIKIAKMLVQILLGIAMAGKRRLRRKCLGRASADILLPTGLQTSWWSAALRMKETKLAV